MGERGRKRDGERGRGGGERGREREKDRRRGEREEKNLQIKI